MERNITDPIKCSYCIAEAKHNELQNLSLCYGFKGHDTCVYVVGNNSEEFVVSVLPGYKCRERNLVTKS